jgi:hypothetical protein
LVKLSLGHEFGFTFEWKRDGAPLPNGEAVLIPRAGARKFLVPASDPGTAWRSGDVFDDSAWTSVAGGIGYDTNTTVNFLPHIAAGGNVQAKMKGSGKPSSAMLRMPFTLTTPAALSWLKFRYQCDDGFVAWLNGTEIASMSKPATLAWNSGAIAGADDATAIVFQELGITQFTGLLRAGENLLAVQALNQNNSSSDFLFNCELSGGTDAANSPVLILPAVRLEDAGAYTVTVTNSTGTVTSDPAMVAVSGGPPPAIVSQPAELTVERGQSAHVEVTATGPGTLTFQWFTGLPGDTSHPVPGASAPAFDTPPLTDTTNYWVRVANPGGTVDSSVVTVVVQALETFTNWKAAVFNSTQLEDQNISGPDADPDGDGIGNQTEYVLGGAPLSADQPAALVIAFDGGRPALSFSARAASGPGYAGRTRHYRLESAAGPGGEWRPVPGFDSIAGAGQTVALDLTPPLPERTFYRLRVSLTP